MLERDVQRRLPQLPQLLAHDDHATHVGASPLKSRIEVAPYRSVLTEAALGTHLDRVEQKPERAHANGERVTAVLADGNGNGLRQEAQSSDAQQVRAGRELGEEKLSVHASRREPPAPDHLHLRVGEWGARGVDDDPKYLGVAVRM